MIETILIARERKSRKQVILLGSEVDFNRQKERLHEFDDGIDEGYDTIGLYSLTPMKKVLRPITQKEADARLALHETQIAGAKPPVAHIAPPPNEFTAEDLSRKTRGELLEIAGNLVEAKRLAEQPSGNKSKIIEAILTATPLPGAPASVPASPAAV